MDWITLDTLKTVGGASLAVTIVTAAIKFIAPGIKGRRTHLLAFGISIAIAALVGKWTSIQEIAATLLNGFVVFTVAVGLDQTINYNKRYRSKSSRNGGKAGGKAIIHTGVSGGDHEA